MTSAGELIGQIFVVILLAILAIFVIVVLFQFELA